MQRYLPIAAIVHMTGLVTHGATQRPHLEASR